MKIRLKEQNNSLKLDYFKVQELIQELFEQDLNKHSKDKDKDGNKKPIFPMDYVLFKFPNIKTVLTELLTVTFRNYIDNIYVMAPKPTTFKIVLRNKQDFLIIYNERSYIVKISGKKYYLLNLNEREQAINAIADLLNTKKFITSKVDEDEKSDDKEKSGKLGRPKGSGGGGSSSSPSLGGGPSPDSDGDEELPDLPPEVTGAGPSKPEESEPEEEPLAENFTIRISKKNEIQETISLLEQFSLEFFQSSESQKKLEEIKVFANNSFSKQGNSNFEKGKNVSLTIYNCIKVNPNISEKKLISTILNEYKYSLATLINALRPLVYSKKISRVKVINPETKRKVYVYRVAQEFNQNTEPKVEPEIQEIKTQPPIQLFPGKIYRFKDYGDDEWRNNYEYWKKQDDHYIFLDREGGPGSTYNLEINTNDLVSHFKDKRIELQPKGLSDNSMGDLIYEIQVKAPINLVRGKKYVRNGKGYPLEYKGKDYDGYYIFHHPRSEDMYFHPNEIKKFSWEEVIDENITPTQQFFIDKANKKKLANIPPSIPKVEKRQEIKNINYYQQLLNNTPLSPNTKQYYQSVIDSIRSQSNLASSKQLVILQKLKQGNLQEIKTFSKKLVPNWTTFIEMEKLWNNILTKLDPILDKAYQDKNFAGLSDIFIKEYLPLKPYYDSFGINFEYFKDWIRGIDEEDLPKKSPGSFYDALHDDEWLNIITNEFNLQEIKVQAKTYTASEVLELFVDTWNASLRSRLKILPFIKELGYKDKRIGWVNHWIPKLDKHTLQKLGVFLTNLRKEYEIPNNEQPFRLDTSLDESRISDLKTKLVGKQLDENEFNEISKIPVPKPIYTEWLINTYVKEFKSQGKNIDDFMKENINQKIEYFEKNKSLFQSKDITSYSYDSLNQEINKIDQEIGPKGQDISNNDLDRLKKVGIKNLGIVNGYQVIKIPKGVNSQDAFNAYRNIICQGRTKVCTASNYTRFEYYTTNDNLYLLVSSEDPKAPYHISRFTDQFKDKNDQDITDPKILDIIKQLK